MSDNVKVSEKLTPRQERAVAALLASRNLTAAAELAGVTPRTLYRWLQIPEFRAEIKRAQEGALDEIGRRLFSGQAEAMNTLETIMKSEDAKTADRRRAGVAWLDFVFRFIELQQLDQRIAALEAAVNGPKTGN